MTFHHVAPARLTPARLLAVVTGLVMLLAVVLVLSNRVSAVTLLTDPTPPGIAGCYTSGIAGPLVVDAVYGTAVTQHGTVAGVPQEWSYPVQWPFGYTGRRTLGGEVEVLDRRGNVWARTGTNVSMMGGYEGNPGYWVACGWIRTY